MADPALEMINDEETKREKKEKKRRKKDKKARKEKRSRPKKHDDEPDDDGTSNCSDDARQAKKKLKKEKKRQKRKKLQETADSSPDSAVAEAAAPESSSRKKRKHQATADNDTESQGGHKNSTCGLEFSSSNPKLSASGNSASVSVPRPFVESSALQELKSDSSSDDCNTTLVLFYQYVEPEWSSHYYSKTVKPRVESIAAQAGVKGRMRVAREGLNCTLTGSKQAIYEFCHGLRAWQPELFGPTEFKMTHDLPQKQAFGDLKLIPVTELVNYGLDGGKAPPIQHYGGTHLEPRDYHQQLAQSDTVVIDVRNHYEATIGRFEPPAQWLDPKMRKSTEFPVWLDDPQTQESLKDKTVLMYCTGGIRCERASALLKYKMETDPAVKDLNIKGVFQLQGGIDKYFKEFPDGGFWKGKNYVFDKRFAHYPPVQHAMAVSKDGRASASIAAGSHTSKSVEESDVKVAAADLKPLGKCEACGKAWDMYRGKRRCPTCGVPSLICRECWKAHEDGTKLVNRSVRCDLCIEQNIRSKKDLREKEQRELQEYEGNLLKKGLLLPKGEEGAKITRLFLRNMCRKNMTDEILMQTLPGITHIVWRTDRKSGEFSGQGWVEMESAEAAALAVAKSGGKILGRPVYIEYQAADGKDAWPPPSSAVGK